MQLFNHLDEHEAIQRRKGRKFAEMCIYSNKISEIRFSQILANECKVSGSAEMILQELDELRLLEKENKMDQARFKLKQAVEKLSNSKNTVIYDAFGIPSVMVEITAVNCEDLIDGTRMKGTHPAFLYGQYRIRRIWVSKYINCLVEGKTASLPMSEPAYIPNFEVALQSVKGKGPGWMIMPFQLRMAILLQMWKHQMNPTGNTDIGQDYYKRSEIGIQTTTGSVLTGSGPKQWTHNGQTTGIWDLVGNLNEWDCGFRLMNGEIQLIDTVDLLRKDCSFEVNSSYWHALDKNGKRVLPGNPEALHFDGHDGAVRITTKVEEHGLGNCAFRDVSSAEGFEVPELLKMIGLYPAHHDEPERIGWRWINTKGEAMPLCGGAFRIMNHSGLFFMGVTKQRDVNYPLSGVRSVYISKNDFEEANVSE